MCDISEHNPELGIDGPTVTKLLSRKRASGGSPYTQWKEIWNLLFPDDDDSTIKSWGRFYQNQSVPEPSVISNDRLIFYRFLSGYRTFRVAGAIPLRLKNLPGHFT
jgi:hypothetical protein